MLDFSKISGQGLNLDKGDWVSVKFGEVAIKQNKKVDRETTDLTRYVKGEHMGSQDLHLRKWGELKDEYLGPAFTRKFEEGDILYGSRRTYLRKVVIAPFEGITSNTTFVIKANEEKIDKRLLPFVMMSEGFTEHAIRNSKGSVNPYINWKDIANYQFLMPKKEIQASILELLANIDASIEADIATTEALRKKLVSETEFQIHGINLLGKTIREVIAELKLNTQVTTLGELGEFFKGKGIAKSDVLETGIPCVRYGELYTRHNIIVRQFHSFINQTSANSSVKLSKNDLLFAGSGETITEIGKSAAFMHEEDTFAGSDIIVFRPIDMDGIYLGYLMNSIFSRSQLNLAESVKK